MKFSELVSEKTRLSLPSDPDIGGIASDSEKAAPGCLFVCIDGMHSDGHSFIDEAASRGAAAFVISQSHPEAEEKLTSAGIPFAVYGRHAGGGGCHNLALLRRPVEGHEDLCRDRYERKNHRCFASRRDLSGRRVFLPHGGYTYRKADYT